MEKIKILAFGCSHSLPAFEVDEDNKYGENTNFFNNSIFELIFDDNERFDLTIISCSGQGILSYYQILSRGLGNHNWADKFDKIVVQQTTEPRWMFYSNVALDKFFRELEIGGNEYKASAKNKKHYSLCHATYNGLYDEDIFKMEFQIRQSQAPKGVKKIDTKAGSIRYSPIFFEVPVFYYEKFFDLCCRYRKPVLSYNFCHKSFTHCEPQYRLSDGSVQPVEIPYLDSIIADKKFKARDHANSLGVERIAEELKPRLINILAG